MTFAHWLKLPEEYRRWDRAFPVVTLMLVLVFVLVYLGRQSHDQDVLQQAIESYRQTPLFKMELPAYAAFVESQHTLYANARIGEKYERLLEASKANYRGDLILPDMVDAPEFVAYMQREGSDMMSPDAFAQWQTLRAGTETILAKASLRTFGLRGQEAELSRFLSASFYPAHVWSLALLLPLVLFAGYGAEKRLRSGLYGPITLSLAMLTSLLLTRLMPEGMLYAGPLFLVSAITGLHFGCYWNRSLGLVSLTGWAILLTVGNQITAGDYGHNWVTSGLATGTFLLGFNLIQVYSRLQQKEHDRITRLPRHENKHLDPTLWPDDFRMQYATGLDELGQMAFGKARQTFEKLLTTYPDHPLILEALFNLYKYSPNPEKRLVWARKVLAQSIARKQFKQAAHHWHEFLHHGGQAEEMEQSIPIMLIHGLIKSDELRLAEDLVRQLILAGKSSLVLKEVLPELIQTLRQQERTLKIQDYERALAQLSGGGDLESR
ncbi:MAG: hypothetical protein IPM37_09250 [Hahellaceae bacterium]|nr:hypothetical protein [Hahellaceae bacterium]